MPNVYIVDGNGLTVQMKPVRCEDEANELQRLLENNPQLMPGDQIRPSDPRRWLLIKREMPVPDPSSGENRWSIDHFFVDQDATPTFVECKRFLDTRSRREVVGQMLDYAANGHWYWEREDIRNFADETAKENGIDFDQALRNLSPQTEGGVDEFFEQVESNLRQGQIRMVFFMEEAPAELKSIVDFLNKQMERSEILIVEAKQFQSEEGLRVIAPTLFGFTEEARRVKKTVTVSSGQKKKWNEVLFFQDAESRLKPEEVKLLRAVYDHFTAKQIGIRWGGGKVTGSFSLLVPNIISASFFSVSSDGSIFFNFGYIVGSPEADAFREQLDRAIRETSGLVIPDNTEGKYPMFKISAWGPKVNQLMTALDQVLDSAEQVAE